MPRKSDALPIGSAPCLECGAENAVYQNAKQYLYMRGCPCCGTADQRISEKVQTKLFYSLKAGEGAQVERPRNVPEKRPAWLDDTSAQAPAPEPSTVQVPSAVPSTAPAKKRGGGGLLLIFAGIAGTLLAVAGIVTNTNTTTPRAAA